MNFINILFFIICDITCNINSNHQDDDYNDSETLKMQNVKIIKKEKSEIFKDRRNFTEIISFVIEPNETESLFEKIESLNSFYFAFMTNDTNNKIDFLITGPTLEYNKGYNGILYSKSNINFLYFKFRVFKEGEYAFHFTNNGNNLTKITVGLNFIENLEEIMTNITRIQKKFDLILANAGYFSYRMDYFNDCLKINNKSLKFQSVIEVFIMIIIFILQWIYLKKLLNKI